MAGVRSLPVELAGDELDLAGDEQLLVREVSPPVYGTRRRAALGAAALLLGCIGVMTCSNVMTPILKGSEKDVDVLDTEPNQVESGQYNWQIVHTERDLCSTSKDNCINSKCCKTSGFHCFGLTDTKAQCLKGDCIPGPNKACKPLSKTLSLEADSMKPARKLFCFSVYTANTGSTKKNHELELLTMQFAKNVSIFACEEYAVYSDGDASLGGGLVITKVPDVKGDFHFAKRKKTGAWINTGMFIQVWKAIGEAGHFAKWDWVVKVDPDAVFVPERLRNRIQWMPRTVSGSVLQNCKYVDYGFFGNLEVYSITAFKILLANLDTCYTLVPWKIGIKNGIHGPMGEDLFAEICMEKNGVNKIEAFDVTADGACAFNRPEGQKKNKTFQPDCKTQKPAMHPFKKPDAYFKCLDETMAYFP